MARVIDIATVSFIGDLRSLKLQARSIDRKFAHVDIGNIFVICNDRDRSKFEEMFNALVRPEYGALADRVQLVFHEQCGIMGIGNFGWGSQQALKLGIYHLVTAEKLLILDSKNHFIRPVNYESFVDPDGRMRMWRVSDRGHLKKYMDGSFEAFGLDSAPFVDKALPTITPFVADRNNLMALDQACESLFSMPVTRLIFHRWQSVSEFYLISAFVIKQYGTFDVLYSEIESPVVTLFPDKVKDDNSFGSNMHRLDRPDIHTFSIHWASFEHLTPDQKTRISDLWENAGLVADRAEAAEFLEHIPR